MMFAAAAEGPRESWKKMENTNEQLFTTTDTSLESSSSLPSATQGRGGSLLETSTKVPAKAPTTTTTTTTLGVIEPFLRIALLLEDDDDDDEQDTTSPSPSLSTSSLVDDDDDDDDSANHKSDSIWSSSSQTVGGGGARGELHGRQDAVDELVQALERCCRCAVMSDDDDVVSASNDAGVGDDDNDAAAAAALDAHNSFELVLITGSSGTGKTSLANRALKPLVLARGGFFISAKFEQFLARSAPYYPVQQAFQQFVQQVLHGHSNHHHHHGHDDDGAENTTHVITTTTTLQEEMQHIVDPIVASEPLLLNMLPALKDLVSQGIVAVATASNKSEESNSNALSGPSTEHRVLQSLVKLLRAVCSPSRPLVLFLDDLQWADEACLNLLSMLVNSESSNTSNTSNSCKQAKEGGGGNGNMGLMILGACRGNEVSVDHDLAVTLREMEEELSVRITDIRLSNLNLDDIQEMLLSEQHGLETIALDRTVPLVEYILEQTGGNPMFVRQFLMNLDDEGLLEIDSETDQYAWENNNQMDGSIDATARNLGLGGGSAVRLVTKRIQGQLHPKVQRILMLAACLGAEFEQEILETLTGKDVNRLLWTAKEKHLITRLKSTTGCRRQTKRSWRFNHDQIQQACYGLIPEQNRDRCHLDIGWSLFQTLSSQKLDYHLNSIVDQLTRGADLIKSPSDCEQVASLLLLAAEKSVKAASFRTAAERLHLAIRLLGQWPRHWRDQYHLSLDIWCAAAEIEYANGNFQECDDLIAQVLDNAIDFDDCLRPYTTMVFALGSRAQLAKAIELGIMVLGKGLGEHFPTNPTSIHVAFELLKTKRLLSKFTDADILALPKMIESNKLVALRLILLLVVYTASLSDPIFPFLTMRLVQLTIRYGISAMSAPVFSMWGMLLCNGVKDIEGGVRYARLGLTLQNHSSTGEWQSRVQVFSNGFCLIWTESLCDQLDSLQESHDAGIRTGDIESAVLASGVYSRIALHVSEQLPRLAEKMEIFLVEATNLKQDIHAHFLKPLLQLAHNLLGRATDPSVLTGDVMNEEKAIQLVTIEAKNASIYTLICCIKLMLCYLFGRIDEAERLSKLIDKECKTDTFSSLALGDMYLYQGLTALAGCGPSSSFLRRRQGIRRAKRKLKQLKWIAKLNPTFQSQVLIVQGEIAAVRGQVCRAVRIFDEAVSFARKDRVLGEIALARERAAAALERAMVHDGPPSPAAGPVQQFTRPGSSRTTTSTFATATADPLTAATCEYWDKAIVSYAHWGAKAKVDQLKRHLLELKGARS